MTDDELRDLVASLAVANKELRDSQKVTDAQLAKTDAKLNKLAELISVLHFVGAKFQTTY